MQKTVGGNVEMSFFKPQADGREKHIRHLLGWSFAMMLIFGEGLMSFFFVWLLQWVNIKSLLLFATVLYDAVILLSGFLSVC